MKDFITPEMTLQEKTLVLGDRVKKLTIEVAHEHPIDTLERIGRIEMMLREIRQDLEEEDIGEEGE